MTNRSGDWKDLLSVYHRALKGNKIWVGFLTSLAVLLILIVGVVVYGWFAEWGLMGRHANAELVRLGDVAGEVVGDPPRGSIVFHIVRGEGLQTLPVLVQLLNPLWGPSIGHFLVSVLVWLALFWVLSGPGGVISRLSALEYARDDFPTLGEAQQLVRGRRLDYFLSFLWPALVVAVPVLIMLLIGLFCSIPVVGRIALVPLYPVAALLGGVAWLFAIGWVLSFGMMMPAVSVGGKDAFDGWSTSYAYVLWQFGRYACYTLLAGLIGLVSAVAAFWLVEVLIYFVVNGINLGFIGVRPWLEYEFGGAIIGPGAGLAGVVGFIIMLLTLGLRVLPLAYIVSYFFTGETLIFFLLRKHVDNIEIDEIYEETEEEEPILEEVAEPVAEGEEAAEEAETEAEEAAPGEEPEAEEAETAEEPLETEEAEEPHEPEQEEQDEEERD